MTADAEQAPIDRLIVSMLLVYGPRWDELAEELAGFGPAALHRLFDLWTGQATSTEVAEAFDRLGREVIDEINAVFGFLAQRFPSVYLDRMRRPPDTFGVLVMARLVEPRVLPELRAALGQSDWLVRMWAARGLLDRPEPAAAEALADALADPEFVVRRLAIIGLARHDRSAALTLLDAVLADPALAERDRDTAGRDRHALRSGQLPRADR